MAYIHVDIDEYVDEIDTHVLISEIKSRAKREKKSLNELFNEEIMDDSIKERISSILGLNHLASKEDIIAELECRLR